MTEKDLILHACDNKSLYLFFDQIEKSADLDPETKFIISATKRKILGKIDDIDIIKTVLKLLPVNELANKLIDSVREMNFSQVEAILKTAKIPTDYSRTSSICAGFTYAGTTDEKACKMLKMLIEYGFDWHCCNNGPCQYSIINIDFPKVIELLLDSGLDVNHTFSGETLIKLAIRKGRNVILRLLIERGAKVDKLFKKKLSLELQKLLEERDIPVAVPIVSITNQQAANEQLSALIKQITGHPAFVKSSVKVIEFYHRHIFKFVEKYNSESDDFIASFDPETSMLTITWKD